MRVARNQLRPRALPASHRVRIHHWRLLLGLDLPEPGRRRPHGFVLYFGRRLLRIANSANLLRFMGIFITLCLIERVLSIAHWVRAGRAA